MNRRALILILVIALAACGFQPMHGQTYREKLSVDLSSLIVNVTTSAVTTSTTINSSTSSNVPRRYSELLKAEIRDRVNPMNDVKEKLFTLDINYNEIDVSLFVRPDGTASRGNLIYSSTYVITRIADQKQVSSGALTSTSSYNTALTADYASYVSVEDARKRAVLDLAENYKLRLAALLPTLNNPDASSIEAKPEAIPVLQPVRGYENSTPRY